MKPEQIVLCGVNDCTEHHYARGYCVAHYRRFKRHGDPLAGRHGSGRAPIAERLSRRLVTTASGCMEWTGARWPNGYGNIRSGEAPYRAKYTHRVAWEVANGRPVPAGMLVCHSCDNRVCCNAAHLFLGTHADNMRDMTDKARQARGERSGQAKLTEVQVVEILRLWALGMTHVAIAARVGTSNQNVGKICRGERWAHVGVQR